MNVYCPLFSVCFKWLRMSFDIYCWQFQYKLVTSRFVPVIVLAYIHACTVNQLWWDNFSLSNSCVEWPFSIWYKYVYLIWSIYIIGHWKFLSWYELMLYTIEFFLFISSTSCSIYKLRNFDKIGCSV